MRRYTFVTALATVSFATLLMIASSRSSLPWAGYLVSHSQLAALPPGTMLDQSGRMYWHALPGYLGTFDLLFIRSSAGGQSESLSVRVTIQPH